MMDRHSLATAIYAAQAELFRTLGHPVRIRVLELLQAGPTRVRDLLADLEIAPAALSQQLAVLRRSGIVTASREGAHVVYALAGIDLADLMRATHQTLTQLIDERSALRAELDRVPVETP